jgi:hypothetical protein
VKAGYRPHVPERLWVAPDGTVSPMPLAGAVEAWWQPRPLMLYPRCRASFELRQKRARSAMVDLLEYLALEDLGRAWRVAQPNLEQCGLLRVDYDGLDELAADGSGWFGVPQLEAMPAAARAQVLRAVLDHLRGALAIEAELLGRERGAHARGVRLKVGALQWQPGDGRVPPPDAIRARSLHLRRENLRRAEPNAFFSRLYRDRALALAGMLAGEHTGQVMAENRVRRETEFVKGELSVLCCSPTMELGVDIRELAVVHLRNIPPNPANCA